MSHASFSRLSLLLCASSTLLLWACAGPRNYGRSVNATEGGYSFKHVQAKPPNLMVAKKFAAPLYVVVDPKQAPDSFQVSTSACALGPDSVGCERFTVFDAHQVIRRDLRAVLSAFFDRVEVIEAGTPLPTTPHLRADVKFDDLRLQDDIVGRYTYTRIQLTWGVGLRWAGDDDYAFSFAGTAQSEGSYPTFEAGLGQMVEAAMAAMLKTFVEGKGLDAIRAKAGAVTPRGASEI